jgi:hypothetical protein
MFRTNSSEQLYLKLKFKFIGILWFKRITSFKFRRIVLICLKILSLFLYMSLNFQIRGIGLFSNFLQLWLENILCIELKESILSY